MKGKLIGLGIVVALVIVAGLSVNQIKTNPGTSLSAETVSPTPSTPSTGLGTGGLGTDELDENQYAKSTVRVGNKTFSVELALTPETQLLGLGQRDSLAKNSGMLFTFKPAQTITFWMKDMRFSLDMVWIADGKVVHISRNLPAPQKDIKPENLPIYSANTPVDYVLEINAGEAVGLKIGDSVEIVDSFSI